MRDLQVLVPATEVTLGADGRGSITASVTLAGGSPEKVVLTAIATDAPPVDSWTTIEHPLRDLTPGTVEQFRVDFTGEALTPGRFPVTLVAYPSSEAPEEYSGHGQRLTVVVPVKQVPPPPPPTFPWLLVAIAAVVVLVLAAGGFFIFRPKSVPVPQVLSVDLKTAEKRLHDAGFMVKAKDVYGPAVGVVNKQEPSSGAAKKGSYVIIYFDSGAPVPILVGLTPPKAQVALENVHLEMSPLPDDAFNAVALITDTSLEPGAMAPRGRPLSVTIGVKVPNVTTLPAAAAEHDLQALKFKTRRVRYPTFGPPGIVDHTSIVADSYAPLGTTIDLWVTVPIRFISTGPTDGVQLNAPVTP